MPINILIVWSHTLDARYDSDDTGKSGNKHFTLPTETVPYNLVLLPSPLLHCFIGDNTMVNCNNTNLMESLLMLSDNGNNKLPKRRDSM